VERGAWAILPLKIAYLSAIRVSQQILTRMVLRPEFADGSQPSPGERRGGLREKAIGVSQQILPRIPREAECAGRSITSWAAAIAGSRSLACALKARARTAHPWCSAGSGRRSARPTNRKFRGRRDLIRPGGNGAISPKIARFSQLVARIIVAGARVVVGLGGSLERQDKGGALAQFAAAGQIAAHAGGETLANG
jgi:hypothetical protein